MIVLFLLAQTAGNISLAQLRAMSPAAAGDAVLRDKEHEPVVTFKAPTAIIMEDVVQGELVERPVLIRGFCQRRRWTITFSSIPRPDVETAIADQDHAYSSREIAFPTGNVCPSGKYVHLDPNVTLEQGEYTLKAFSQMLSPKSRTIFLCHDEIRPSVCRGDKYIKAVLRTRELWAVSSRSGDLGVSVDGPGNADTEVRFKPNSPFKVTVTRRVPAPF